MTFVSRPRFCSPLYTNNQRVKFLKFLPNWDLLILSTVIEVEWVTRSTTPSWVFQSIVFAQILWPQLSCVYLRGNIELGWSLYLSTSNVSNLYRVKDRGFYEHQEIRQNIWSKLKMIRYFVIILFVNCEWKKFTTTTLKKVKERKNEKTNSKQIQNKNMLIFIFILNHIILSYFSWYATICIQSSDI